MGMLWESAMLSFFSEKKENPKRQIDLETDYHSFITKKTEQKPFWHDMINQAETEAAAIPKNPTKQIYKRPLWLDTVLRSKRHCC